jgi:hypothetical protein
MTHYFAEDGSYGVAGSLAIFDCSDWNEEDWQKIEECQDKNRLQIAVAIADEKKIKDHPARELA